MNLTNGLLLAAALALSCAAIAGEFQYECKVGQVFHIDNGKGKSSGKDIAIGEMFTISRETGEIVGSPAFRLHRGQGWKTLQVLDRGSSQQSFKMLAVSSGPYTNTAYVEVNEYKVGPEKTFIYYSNFLMTVGICK